MTKYRKEHPEYYEAEKKRDMERMKAKYADPIEKEKQKKRALEYYYKKKAEKQNISTSSNNCIQVC
jgi:hypothetical protein